MATDYILFIHGVNTREERENPEYADQLFNRLDKTLVDHPWPGCAPAPAAVELVALASMKEGKQAMSEACLPTAAAGAGVAAR